MSQQVLPALVQAPKPACRSLLSTILWEAEAPLTRLFSGKPPPGAPRRLNLGCGNIRPAGWLHADFATPRWLLQGRRWPQWNVDATRRWRCDDDHFDMIHCEHLLEHFPYQVSIHVLRECRRTLRRGGILRAAVPDVKKYVAFYSQPEPAHKGFLRYRLGTAAFSALTQCNGHLSVWDGPTLAGALSEVGFREVRECGFGQSGHPEVIDRSDRAWETCYVEGTK
jgi:SAM-dependent methyltransferase